MAQHAFIIGGTGQIGRALTVALLDRGWSVSVGCRGSNQTPQDATLPGAKVVAMDRENAGEIARALGRGADLLVDTVGYDAPHARQLLEVQDDVGQLLTISSVSVYRDHLGRTLDEAAQAGFPEFANPITEKQATVAPGPETYSTRKIAMERTLLDGARVPAAILRPCAIHGPNSRRPREWWFVKRLLDGRSQIPLAYMGRSQFHTSAVANIAGLIATIGEKRFTGVVNAVDPTAPTITEIGHAIMAAIGRQAELVPMSDMADPSHIGSSPWSVPRPFVISDAAARALGFVPSVDYAQAAKTACRWLVALTDGSVQPDFPELGDYPWFDYAAEDTWLEAAGRGVQELSL